MLSSHADEEGICYPSLTTIALESGMAERHVKGALAALKERGVVERLPTTRGTVAFYRLHHPASAQIESVVPSTDFVPGIAARISRTPGTCVVTRPVQLSPKLSTNSVPQTERTYMEQTVNRDRFTDSPSETEEERIVAEVVALFPEARPAYVRELLQSHSAERIRDQLRWWPQRRVETARKRWAYFRALVEVGADPPPKVVHREKRPGGPVSLSSLLPSEAAIPKPPS